MFAFARCQSAARATRSLERVAHCRASTRGARGPRPSGAGSRKCKAAKASVSVRKKLARKAIARRARGFLLYQRAAAWLFEDVSARVRVILAALKGQLSASSGALRGLARRACLVLDFALHKELRESLCSAAHVSLAAEHDWRRGTRD